MLELLFMLRESEWTPEMMVAYRKKQFKSSDCNLDVFLLEVIA
jgi:hypothetical protein